MDSVDVVDQVDEVDEVDSMDSMDLVDSMYAAFLGPSRKPQAQSPKPFPSYAVFTTTVSYGPTSSDPLPIVLSPVRVKTSVPS